MTVIVNDDVASASDADWPAAGPGEIPVPQGAWFSVAGTSNLAALSPEAFAQGGAADGMGPGALLAALAEGACDPDAVTAVSDNALLGVVGASQRLMSRAAAITQRAVAEYARRHHAQPGTRASRAGYTEFSPDDLAPELVVNTNQAEGAMVRHESSQRRLPACSQVLWDGQLSEYLMRIIADQTACLDDKDAAEADQILANAAPGLTPGQLRALAARVVLMIDPDAAEERRKDAATRARVIKFREEAGTGALCGRDLPPQAVLASWEHVDGTARALLASGVKATLDQLRSAVYLGLTSGTDPLTILPLLQEDPGEQHAPEHSTRNGSADGDRDPSADDRDLDGGRGADDASGADDVSGAHDVSGADDGSDGGADGESGEGGARRDGPGPSGPRGPEGSSGPAGGGAGAPFPAVINLLIPVGTAFGWSSAPGEIPGWGPLDPETARDMMAAASRHPSTRWCVTPVDIRDGTAAAHGCAPCGRSLPWWPRAAVTMPSARTGTRCRAS